MRGIIAVRPSFKIMDIKQKFEFFGGFIPPNEITILKGYQQTKDTWHYQAVNSNDLLEISNTEIAELLKICDFLKTRICENIKKWKEEEKK